MILRKRPYLVKCYDEKLENKLLDKGFKRVWFDDKSGYWMEYKIKSKILDCVFKIYVEPDNLRCYYVIYANNHYDEYRVNGINISLEQVNKVYKQFNKICKK